MGAAAGSALLTSISKQAKENRQLKTKLKAFNDSSHSMLSKALVMIGKQLIHNFESAKSVLLDDLIDCLVAIGATCALVLPHLWVQQIKHNSRRKFEKLNPRWCLKVTTMDRDLYKSFAEMTRMSTIKIVLAVNGR